MKKYFLASVLFLLLSGLAQSQDIHFSQFNASPLTLNAANTGNMDSKYRVTANYRDQWASVSAPYVTSAMAVDFSLKQNKKNFFGAGILGIYDKSGTSELTNKSIYASGAYHLHVGKADTPKHYLHIGFQAGFTNRTIDVSKVAFVSSYDPITHTFNTVPLSEINDNVNYFDMNVGAAWSSVITKKFSFIAGLSLVHINQPKVLNLIYNSQTILKTTTKCYITSNYKCNQKFSFSPAIYLLKQTRASELTVGSSINYSNKKTVLYAGAYYRLSDATILMLGAQAKNIRLGLSYDFNVSNLHSGSNYKGGFELSLAYCPIKTNKKLVFYPKN